ncbi:hypothetical protein GCM10007216_18290 [Thalassobacillus devorans]|uniref:Uncharacterized protein n=1 Tax=Thalassobacillus devorans TaxID=279813 RepID=A0ABQ1NZS5_9BACI|nr:hypothetical protein [Thalassobacillus devorans]NIK28227.1 hypothetical protein [Thalassobacillus devorans]GGC87887.1 hypothetical protein GCM10007216_18290 [Thalassobacillus devorans]
MSIKRFFNNKGHQTINDIFQDLVRSNFDVLEKKIYDTNKANTVASFHRERVNKDE